MTNPNIRNKKFDNKTKPALQRRAKIAELRLPQFGALPTGLKCVYIKTARWTLGTLSSYLTQTLFPWAFNRRSSLCTKKMHLSGLGLLSLQTFFYISSILRPVQAQNKTCKPTTNDASWPSISQWNSLNQTLSGRLLYPLPPASACHSFGPGSNDTCAEITASWSEFTFHQDNPVSTAWNNMNNDSCLPDQQAPCSGLGYPVYVVNASSANDVKLAVDFAREHNVRLNIKASGHDYMKR